MFCFDLNQRYRSSEVDNRGTCDSSKTGYNRIVRPRDYGRQKNNMATLRKRLSVTPAIVLLVAQLIACMTVGNNLPHNNVMDGLRYFLTTIFFQTVLGTQSVTGPGTM